MAPLNKQSDDIKCSDCDTKIRANALSIRCCLCKSWYHKGCSHLTTKDFNNQASQWKKSKKTTWVCLSCEGGVIDERNANISFSARDITLTADVNDSDMNNAPLRSSQPYSSSEILNGAHCNISTGELQLSLDSSDSNPIDLTKKEVTLNEAIAAILRLQRVISEQSKATHALMNELKILRTTNQKVEQLEADIKQLREEVHDLKNKTKPEDITNVVLKETIERKLRANNFIIFGSPDSNTAGTMEEDVTLAKDIIIATTKDIDKKNTVAKVFRLGKFNQNKPRPIKVICTSSELVNTTLRNSKNLKNTPNFAGLYISNDKTHKQLEEYNHVKSQLIGRTKGGEPNLRIKYINGHPTIVSSAGSVNLK